jgi:hypothetical protein
LVIARELLPRPTSWYHRARPILSGHDSYVETQVSIRWDSTRFCKNKWEMLTDSRRKLVHSTRPYRKDRGGVLGTQRREASTIRSELQTYSLESALVPDNWYPGEHCTWHRCPRAMYLPSTQLDPSTPSTPSGNAIGSRQGLYRHFNVGVEMTPPGWH